ncbi:MAG: fibronectin type III domain-containing protein, partial [Flavobacteriales bacterium]|nr:fibronectin type III domain-containing protein [Flavobacteriales bacterium]
MKNKFTLLLVAVAIVYSGFAQVADTITVMQYNLLYYGISSGNCNSTTNNISYKNTQLRTIIDYVTPDVFCVNELGVGTSPNEDRYADSILINVLNTGGINYYSRANFTGTSNISNMLFYNTNKLVYHSQKVINLDLFGAPLIREIDAYKMYYNDPDIATNNDTIFCTFLVAHLKAGSASTDSIQRVKATAAAMDFIFQNNVDKNVFFMGDFNIRTSTDQTYQQLTVPTSGLQFNDPINVPGDWGIWPNSAFSIYHTQSTKDADTNSGCFSGGGMDDRFDFILASDSVIVGTSRVSYVSGTYKALGQDGSAFNQEFPVATNTAVPLSVAQALYNISDHLPIVMDIRIAPPGAGYIIPPTPITCDAPTGLNAINITSTTADLNWTIVNPDSVFEVEIVTTGITPVGSGVTTSTTAYSAAGLLPGTTYDYYVRTLCSNPSYSLIITGAYDGPLAGGYPKGIELYVLKDIPNLGVYGIGSANNGLGTDGIEFTFPNVTATAGDYIYATADTAAFRTYMGFGADYETSSMNINGDDAIELFQNAGVIDVFGDINVDGTGQPWEHLDGWAYRNSSDTNNLGVFDETKWGYSGVDAVDGCATNATCSSTFPAATFTGSFESSAWTSAYTFTTLCSSIVSNETTINVLCNGESNGSISLAPTGGGSTYTYNWSTGGTTSSVSGLAPTIYTVTVYSGICSAAQSFSITEPSAITISILAINNISCNGGNDGSIATNVTGGTIPYQSLLWSDGTGGLIINGCGANDPPASMTVTDANGCTSSIGGLGVTEPPAVTITNTLNTSVSCNGICDGSASVEGSGGTSPFTYLWNNGQNSPFASGLCSGTNIVSVTDGNSCLASST